MADREVRCIKKQPRNNAYEGIERLEGVAHPSGSGWWGTRQQVADAIKNKTDRFFTLIGGKRTYLHWRRGARGDYVQTYANKLWNDNLLSLDECPA